MKDALAGSDHDTDEKVQCCTFFESLHWRVICIGMKIQWKPVRGYEDHYEVSSSGNVRNKKKSKRVLKSWIRNGYPTVELWKNGTKNATYIHKLVAEAFLDKGEPLCQVNHKNHIRDDNRVENLEWVSPSSNIVDMWIWGLTKLGYKIMPPDESRGIVERG